MPRRTTEHLLTTAELQVQVARAMSEAELQQNIIEMARGLDWACWHARDSRGQMLVGLPDLFLVKPPVSFWAELKRQDKSPFPMQEIVIDLMRRCGQTVYVWRPSDWLDGTIQRILEGK